MSGDPPELVERFTRAQIIAACDRCDRRRPLVEIAGELFCIDCVKGRGTARPIEPAPGQADLFTTTGGHTS